MRLEKLEWDHIVKDLEGYAKDLSFILLQGESCPNREIYNLGRLWQQNERYTEVERDLRETNRRLFQQAT